MQCDLDPNIDQYINWLWRIQALKKHCLEVTMQTDVHLEEVLT